MQPRHRGLIAMRHKSKALATWLAFLGGSFGLHRFYLHGWRDWAGWLHPWPTLLGLYGAQRMLEFGQDDRLSWVLVPILGLMLAGTMLTAIVYGLMPDEQWNARFNPDRRPSHSGWGTVIGVIGALIVGAVALISTIAYSGQRYFETQVEETRPL
ncbi:MAG: hypothetical protein RLZZ598_1746, partial [Pseudomonadota bacterium]